jgi:homogentisate 1,2-dioxygenase
VRNVELIKDWEPKKVTDSPLRHHHLKTADIPRRGDLYTSRIRCCSIRTLRVSRRPAKATEIRVLQEWRARTKSSSSFKGGGTVETVFGKLPYRAEDYIVIPRGITYRLVPDKVEEEIISSSSRPVRCEFQNAISITRADQDGRALFRA